MTEHPRDPLDPTTGKEPKPWLAVKSSQTLEGKDINTTDIDISLDRHDNLHLEIFLADGKSILLQIISYRSDLSVDSPGIFIFEAMVVAGNTRYLVKADYLRIVGIQEENSND